MVIMSYYTKKPNFYEESEWRMIIWPDSNVKPSVDDKGYNYIMSKIPGKIVRVESRLPIEKHDELSSKIDQSIELIRDI